VERDFSELCGLLCNKFDSLYENLENVKKKKKKKDVLWTLQIARNLKH
jgi:hypothetical protein